MSDANETLAREEMMVEARKASGLVDLLAALLRDKLGLLLWGTVFAVLALVVALFLPPRFTGHVEILPPQMSRAGSAAGLLARSSGPDASGLGGLASILQDRKEAATFVGILNAWPIQDALVKQFHLVEVYHVRSEEAARQSLAKHVAIGLAKDGGFITIDVNDRDRERAAAMANGYVEVLRNFMRELALSEASQQRMFYEGQLAKTKEDLTQAENNFKQMQQHSGVISLDSQAKALIESAASLRAEIAAKEVGLQSVRAYSTESNPQVQMAETELAALRGQLAQVESHSQGGYSGGALSNVPNAELDFVRASRELKYQETLYDLMVREYEGSRIDEARYAPVVQIIEPALPPEKKSGPHRLLIVLAAFGIGVGIRMMMVLGRCWKQGLDPSEKAVLEKVRGAAFGWGR